jgi:hypothetical protein
VKLYIVTEYCNWFLNIVNQKQNRVLMHPVCEFLLFTEPSPATLRSKVQAKCSEEEQVANAQQLF